MINTLKIITINMISFNNLWNDHYNLIVFVFFYFLISKYDKKYLFKRWMKETILAFVKCIWYKSKAALTSSKFKRIYAFTNLFGKDRQTSFLLDLNFAIWMETDSRALWETTIVTFDASYSPGSDFGEFLSVFRILRIFP